MVEGTGILEGEAAAPGNISRRETGVAAGSSVLPEPETCLLAEGETPVLAGDNRDRFCDRLVNLWGLLIREGAEASCSLRRSSLLDSS